MKVADLACGTRHFLNECFDLPYAAYIEEGYSHHSADLRKALPDA